MYRLRMVLLVLTSIAYSLPVVADRGSSPWEIWNSSDETNPAIIDHSLFDGFLKTYVISNHASGINRFRYGDVSGADSKRLKHYMSYLTSIDPRHFRKAEQKAYWLNLYNALMLQGLLKRYPVSTVDRVKLGRQLHARVAGQVIRAADIEAHILRPLWCDYKVVFGLSCATLGCPAIHAQAFTAATTDTLLRQYAREFINHPRGLVVNKHELRVSKIFVWYREDFAQDERQLLRLFAHYADDNKALYILGFNGDITYAFDKRINAPETRWPL